MERFHLIINPGSSTIKYSVFSNQNCVFRATYEQHSKSHFSRILDRGRSTKVTKKIFNSSLEDLLKQIKKKKNLQEKIFQRVAIRYVHGGHLFHEPTKVNQAIEKKLRDLDDLAPLHNPFSRKATEQCRKVLAGVPVFLMFDTAFHAKIPSENAQYAIDLKMQNKHYIRRYGFHGIVCSSIVSQLKAAKALKRRTIICHLGSGCSVTAIKKGQSVDTSMGFTPLEGLIMGTRAGDIDPGILLYLQEKEKLSPQKLSSMLNNESGMIALTGTKDMREILKRVKKREQQAKNAVELFCQKAAKTIASMIVSLDGVDQLVFSGGIGENAPEIRKRICQKLQPFGVKFSNSKNDHVGAGKRFCKTLSRIRLTWMHADEASEMNRVLLEEIR